MPPVLALIALLALPDAVARALDAPSSVDRERGAYALARVFDPEARADRDAFVRATRASSGPERAALIEGLGDRNWPGGMPRSIETVIVDALRDDDASARIAAIGALERFPAERSLPRITDRFATARVASDRRELRALLAFASRTPGAKLREPVMETAAFLLGPLNDATPPLDEPNARVLVAIAAVSGTASALALLPAEERAPDPHKPVRPDFLRTARAEAVRASWGDEAALTKLIETARTAIDPKLRRACIELLVVLPAAVRTKALEVLASEIRAPLPARAGRHVFEDADSPLRLTLVRALQTEPASAPVEALLRAAATDGFPEIRFMALAALSDRGAAWTPVPAETDPLVRSLAPPAEPH